MMGDKKRHDELRKAADAALERAARTAIERATATGTGVYVCENGKIVNILADSRTSDVPAADEALSRVREEPED